MKYTKSQYEELARRFNEFGIQGKLLLIKQNPEIFKLEHHKEDWYLLRLVEDEAMELELDFLFEFPNEISKEQLKNIL